MNEFVFLFISTLISCGLFYRIKLKTTTYSLLNSYKKQLEIILNKTITDELKQKEMMENIACQVKFLAIVVIKLVVLLSPFSLFFLLKFTGVDLSVEVLISIPAIITSLMATFFFIIIRSLYVRLFSN